MKTQCHCEHCSDKPLPTYTEEYRAECEAKFVALMPQWKRSEYLKAIGELRGLAASELMQARIDAIYGEMG